MTDADVTAKLGAPDHQRSYPTYKNFMPWYFGPDTHRTSWMYKGQGQVVFSRHRYNGSLKVLQVVYNPNEMM